MLLDDIIKEIEADCSEVGGHSDIGGSKAEEWFNCPASPIRSKGMPESKKPAATEGTFYHKLGELLLKGTIGIGDLGEYEDETVELQGHTFKITEMMLDGVELYYATVMQRLIDKPFAVLLVEERFCIKSVSDKAYGTSDAVINEPFISLEVIDLKTGRRKVGPESKQLKYYALGVLEKYDTDFDVVKLTIVQPQETQEPVDYRVKTFVLTRKELLEFKEELKAAIKRVENATKDDTCMGDWCIFCKGKAICPEQQKNALTVAQNGFDEVAVTEPKSLSEDKLLWCLDNDEQIRDYLDSVKAYATGQARLGVDIPGRKLVKSVGNRAWTDAANDFLAVRFGEKMYKTVKKVLSPAQIEKLYKDEFGIKKADATKEISKYCFKPEKGTILVKDSDKRDAFVLFDELL